MDVDLKLIYRAIREAVQKDMRGDEDKRVYTVAYKIYDIKAIHHYETCLLYTSPSPRDCS